MFKQNTPLLIQILAALTAVGLGAPASAANLVQNPGFEAGFTNWTLNTNASNPWRIDTNVGVIGTQSASTGCVGLQCTDQTNLATASYLYQDLATTVGSIYNLTFAFTPHAGTPNELKVLWAGAVAFDLINSSDTGAFVSYSVSGLQATGPTTRLTFLGRQDPGYDRLDSIDLELSGGGAVPEPATWALLIVGFAVTGVAARRLRPMLAV